jgi:hypothetical protein
MKIGALKTKLPLQGLTAGKRLQADDTSGMREREAYQTKMPTGLILFKAACARREAGRTDRTG